MKKHQQYFGAIFVLYSLLALWELVSAGKALFVLSSIVLCFMVAASFLTLVFIYAHIKKRYDYVDIAWGPTLFIVAYTSYNIGPYAFSGVLGGLLIFLVGIWAARLSLHIGLRAHRRTSEDPRYVSLREKWKGNTTLNVYIRIYLIQALLATIVSIPLIHINLFDGTTWTYFAIAGLVVWGIGFAVEVIADYQLQDFIKSKKGVLMTQGLWRYSRHPNYFGELLQWWGFGIVALGVYPWWIGLIGPITISYLIIFVSGIPPVEVRFQQKKGWQEYKSRTSMLILWPPKK